MLRPLPDILFFAIATTFTSIPAGAQGSKPQPNPLERYCPSGPTLVTCQRQGEAALFQLYPGLAHRRSNELVLMLTNGDSTIVRDTVSGDSDYGSNYWLADVNERAGYFVLAVFGYENRGGLVISRRTAWRKFIDFNLPVFDPAGRYAAVTIPVGAAYWEPSIEVFRVTPDSLIAELHLQSPSTPDPFVRGDTLWGPQNPRWETGQLLFDTKETLVRNRLKQWRGRPMVLTRVNGRWALRPGK